MTNAGPRRAPAAGPSTAARSKPRWPESPARNPDLSNVGRREPLRRPPGPRQLSTRAGTTCQRRLLTAGQSIESSTIDRHGTPARPRRNGSHSLAADEHPQLPKALPLELSHRRSALADGSDRWHRTGETTPMVNTGIPISLTQKLVNRTVDRAGRLMRGQRQVLILLKCRRVDPITCHPRAMGSTVPGPRWRMVDTAGVS